MQYRLLADAVVLVHFAFILFVVFGAWLALRWRWIPWLHLPCVAWGVLIELAGGICPLTPLENRLRLAGGEAGYAGGFIERYLTPVIYPDAFTRELQLMLGIALALINIVAYLVIWRRRRASNGTP